MTLPLPLKPRPDNIAIDTARILAMVRDVRKHFTEPPVYVIGACCYVAERDGHMRFSD